MAQISKIHYRPIEAAIRWSGLARHERQILDVLNARKVPEANDFPKWPLLRLNTQRIYDGMVNGELRYALNGVMAPDESHIGHPDLTIRHVDLKSWMTRFYPEQKPPFLFTRLERRMNSAITVDCMHALIVERDGLRSQVAHIGKELHLVRSQNGELLKRSDELKQSRATEEALGPRSEMTYHHIVGGLLALLLGHTPSGQPYSSFKTQEAVISAMLAHYGQRLGISQRTLAAKFAAARRALAK